MFGFGKKAKEPNEYASLREANSALGTMNVGDQVLVIEGESVRAFLVTKTPFSKKCLLNLGYVEPEPISTPEPITLGWSRKNNSKAASVRRNG